MKDLRKEAYKEAVKVLERCATPYGFFAAYPNYDAVWSRDSMITSLGASTLGRKFKETFEKSINILGRHQSKKGQIPNCVDIHSKLRKPHVDFGTIDSTLWFVIGNYVFNKRYPSSNILTKNKSKIKKAMTWLSYQDGGEDGMLEQLPTTDWQDAFPHRYGHTINTQALYYKTLELTKNKSECERLKYAVNNLTTLWNGDFYLPWRWKNHGIYQEKGEWFDSLGNLLAIIFNLAGKEETDKILRHIKKEKIASAFPIKAIYPSIEKGSKDWQDYFEDCEAKNLNHYLNGGIWPYIGGFYVLALIKNKEFDEAEKQLKRLAFSLVGEGRYFNEWLDGITGEPSANRNQAWSAGVYLLAYESFRKKKCLI